MRFSIIAQSQTTFLSNYIQKSSHLLLYRYLYHLRYSSISVYNLSLRKYITITTLLQPLVYLSSNLVKIPKFSLSSSLVSYFTLSVPILGLLVTLYIGTLSFIRPSVFNSISCFYYIEICYLNSSMFSFSFLLVLRSLKSSYFIISILTI